MPARSSRVGALYVPGRFSVVIPTRERAHTLRSTLQTCLDQEFQDYEIVVCDNHSSQATREVIEELFLASLCRLPRDAERAVLLARVERAADRRAALEDLLWALLSSKEFLLRK